MCLSLPAKEVFGGRLVGRDTLVVVGGQEEDVERVVTTEVVERVALDTAQGGTCWCHSSVTV